VRAPQQEASGIVEEPSQRTARHRRLAAFAGRSRTAMLWLALMVPEACRVLLYCHENGAYGSCGVRSPAELRLTVSDGTGSSSAMSQKIGVDWCSSQGLQSEGSSPSGEDATCR